ncbi:response regulator transcription factor [Pseudoalteromonas shioyasakiensis]|nr:response regulator transcription factor [Pseudoalteromonas shioyasakiensis]
MSRIILIEDNLRLASLIKLALQDTGILIDHYENIANATLALTHQNYSALILDRGLPDGDGLNLLKHIRKLDIELPCLILTAQNTIQDRVLGLDLGADDYLNKPFAMDELVARVKALLRRPVKMETLSPTWGDLTLFPDTGYIHCGNNSTRLAPTEIQILSVLMKYRGKPVRRIKLEQSAWGLNEAVTPNALDVALHRIRKKLLSLGSKTKIVNVRSIGYVLK